MLITKAKVRKIFNDAGVQCPINTLNIIDADFQRQVEKMAQRCKGGNVKRLTPDLYYIALGKYITKGK